VKCTPYFRFIRSRPDRAEILDAWIERTILHPVKVQIQTDGRIRVWSQVPEAGDRFLRVVLLQDRQTVHNAFFDRRFVP
jgi:hypothetical protein